MRSRAVVAFLVVAIAGATVTLVVATRDDSDMAFTLGVAPGLIAAELMPDEVACQAPVPVPEAFDGVRFQVGTYHRPGPPLEVAIRRTADRRAVASGRLPAGYPDTSQPTVVVRPTVREDARIAVCIRNRGKRRVAIYGGPELAAQRSTTKLDGRDLRTDMTLIFTRERRSALETAPEVFERASLFRPAWVGAWLYWLLAGAIVLLVPALLARSLREAFDADGRSAADGDSRGDRKRGSQA